MHSSMRTQVLERVYLDEIAFFRQSVFEILFYVLIDIWILFNLEK